MTDRQPSMEFASPHAQRTVVAIAQNPSSEAPPRTLRSRARVVGSAALILLALLLGWDVIYGQNGLSAWSAKRTHDRKLTQEIDRLQQENDALGRRIERLRDDPAAIEFQARQSLHYARPNEVIYALPASQQQSAPNPSTQNNSTTSSADHR